MTSFKQGRYPHRVGAFLAFKRLAQERDALEIGDMDARLLTKVCGVCREPLGDEDEALAWCKTCWDTQLRDTARLQRKIREEAFNGAATNPLEMEYVNRVRANIVLWAARNPEVLHRLDVRAALELPLEMWKGEARVTKEPPNTKLVKDN